MVLGFTIHIRIVIFWINDYSFFPAVNHDITMQFKQSLIFVVITHPISFEWIIVIDRPVNLYSKQAMTEFVRENFKILDSNVDLYTNALILFTPLLQLL